MPRYLNKEKFKYEKRKDLSVIEPKSESSASGHIK